MSPIPAAMVVPLTIAMAAMSAGAGIYGAVKKPDTPDTPKAQPNQGVLQADRRRAAAAQGRGSTVLTSQRLGSVGGGGGGGGTGAAGGGI